jgi:hypothetical protein
MTGLECTASEMELGLASFHSREREASTSCDTAPRLCQLMLGSALRNVSFNHLSAPFLIYSLEGQQMRPKASNREIPRWVDNLS